MTGKFTWNIEKKKIDTICNHLSVLTFVFDYFFTLIPLHSHEQNRTVGNSLQGLSIESYSLTTSGVTENLDI